ncbi:PucR family transcriptional regulator [Amycolatopsis sp. NPDC098790]|uniref:PucR family transcriptional regulator n=1 Tax=Amycolatopsis sp. NPDC098790 TaxID=3363939 RepID=UPI00382CFB57
MSTDDVQPIIDALANRLGRSVAVDDPSIRLIAASRHFGDEDAIRTRSVLDREVPRAIVQWVKARGVAGWTGPGHLPADAELGISPRVCAPVRCNNLLLGYLWLIDAEQQIGAEELRLTAEVADSVGLVLYRRMLHKERERSQEESTLRMLISPEREDRRHAIDDLLNENLLAATAHIAVFVIEVAEGGEGDAVALESAVEQVRRALPPRSTLTLVQQRKAIIVVTGARPAGEQHLRSLADIVRRRFTEVSPGQRGCVVGISASHAGLDSAALGHREAGTAVRAARMLPMFGPVASWSALGPFGLLLRVDLDELTEALPLPGLKELLADPAHSGLVTTVEEFLDRAGDVNATAEALHVHRTTLYHRLRRAETVTGLSLNNGLDRLTLHLALKLSKLATASQS